MKLAPPRLHPRAAGSALTIALITVAMVVLLVVLALSIASSDRRVASNALAQESARSLADAALDEVAGKIASIPLDRHWAAAPGRLRIWSGSGWDQVDLHSGDGTGNTNPDESVDLNARLSDGTFPILPPNQEFSTAPEMRVRWIYVSEDGSTSTTPPASGVIGRYAYWADIENGRVNLNTAGLGMTEFNMPGLQSWVQGLTTSLPTLNQAQFLSQYRNFVWARNPWVSDRVGIDADTGRPTFSTLNLQTTLQNTPQYLTAHPSSINLSYLDGVSEEEGFNTFRYAGSYFLRADALTSMLRGGEVVTGTEPFYWDPALAGNVDLSVRFFDAPEDWKRIVDADTFEANKGYITVRGRTPEITPWGTPKLALSFPSRANADQRNDLTETYVRRNVRLFTNIPNTTEPGGYTALNVYETIQDTRMVQMPALNPSWDTFDTANPGRNHRLMIRDLTGGFFNNTDSFRNRATPHRLSVLWAIKQHLAGPLPGVPSSLAAKYDTSSPGEADQVTVEMATFLDNQLAPEHQGRTRTMLLFNQTEDTVLDPGSPDTPRFTDATKKHFSGRRLPYVPANSTVPPFRRLGTYGGPLLNEVVARAFSVPMQIFPATPPTDPPNTQVARIINSGVRTLTDLAKGTLSAPLERISQWGSQDAFVFVLDNPAWLTPPSESALGTTNDRFIRIEFRAEMFLPALWSLRSRAPAYSGYSNFGVHLTDVVCEVNGVAYRVDQTSISDPDDRNTGRSSWIGSLTSVVGPGQYATVAMRTPNSIIIGPFSPAGPSVDLKVKIRLMVLHFAVGLDAAGSTTGANSPTYAAVLPGIFPDFEGNGTPADGVDELFEFSFPNFNVGNPIPEQSSGVTVSLEANDPRVTRRRGDWVTNVTDTIGGQNSVYNPTATADLYRPDPLLPHVRGMLRGRISGTRTDHHLETQTASRILGLPGVGYLSSIPTGVNSGIPWQTMKFQQTSDPVPDWLLWSLFYVPYDRSICDQTDGKLNINATLWPWGIERARPLEALLGDRVSNPELLSRSIASAAGSGKSIGPDDMFVYPGQICQVPGVADSGADETTKEALARDLADIITTQCDDYRVFVVAQPLRQAPDGTFTPTATARLEATISRSPDEDGSGFFLGPESQGDLQVFTRASYQANGNRGTRINVKGTDSGGYGNETRPNGWSNLGVDGRPNTADDWLIPQKVEISALKFLP